MINKDKLQESKIQLVCNEPDIFEENNRIKEWEMELVFNDPDIVKETTKTNESRMELVCNKPDIFKETAKTKGSQIQLVYNEPDIVKETTKTNERKMELVCNEPDIFGENTEQKIRRNMEKAAERRERINLFTKEEIENSKKSVEREIFSIMNEWPALFGEPPNLIYVHVDLDSFYASCEMLCNPSLRNKPIGVGSTMMLATCNYNARKYGIKAGMPGYMAKRLCPQLIIVKCDFTKYNSFSDRVMEVLEKYDNNLEVYGLDEACLIFNAEKLIKACDILCLCEDKFNFENIEKIVECIREDVHKTTGLTISAGISVCRGIAKLCSDLNKPNGQFTLSCDYEEFIEKLNVDEINGIGKYTKMALDTTFGIKTIKDLKCNMNLINLVYPEKSFLNLLRLSYGLISFDYADGSFSKSAKGIAQDVSFTSTESYKFLCETLWLIAKDLFVRLSCKDLKAQTITLKIRFNNFSSLTKQKKQKAAIKSDIDIFDRAYELFMELFTDSRNSFFLERPINLLGIRLTHLINSNMHNNVFKFNNSHEVKYKVCTICDKKLITSTEIGYEKHVMNCIKRINKPVKKSLCDYLKKKVIH